MVKLRLKRMGSKYNAFYRIVVTDSRSPRDGKYIEELGFYNPHTKEIKVNNELRDKWLAQGAVPSETVKKLFTKLDKEGNTGSVIKLPKKVKKTKKITPKISDETEVEAPKVEKSVKESKADETTEEVVENKPKAKEEE